MTDDRAQAYGGPGTPFMTLIITALIVAIIVMDLATDIGQSTDLGANLAGVSLAMIFGTMLLVVVVVSRLGPEVTADD